MTMQQLNIGSAANDGSGEELRSGGAKINANFAEAEARMTAAQVAAVAAQTTANAAIPVTQKGVANGVATLNGSGQVPSAQLPSYVDDVLEFANLAALPATGETGKIYITQDTNFEYRWSGSQYIRLVASPGSTDAVPEGTTNLYFSQSRVRATLLSGLSLVTSAVVAAADTVIVALGKLQAQVTAMPELILAQIKSYGWGLAIADQSPPVTDCNSALVTGTYRIAANGSNTPSLIPGTVIVTKSLPGTLNQEFFESGTAVVWTRGSTDSGATWSVWLPHTAVTNKNLIINGNFIFWQRATSQTVSGFGSADRWAGNNGGTTKTASQQNFIVGQNQVSDNPIFFYRTVVSSVGGAGNYCNLLQTIEDVTRFSGKFVTLSFWARAAVSQNIAVDMLQSFGAGGSPSAQVGGLNPKLFALTTTWQKFSVTTSLPAITGKTLGTVPNSSYFGVRFWFDAGSSLAALAASLGQQSGTFDIAQVKLEFGTVTTGWEPRTISEEFSLCQRYYEVILGTNTTGLPTYFHKPMKVEKRGAPALTLLSGSLVGSDMGIVGGGSNWGVRIPAGTVATGISDYIVSADAEIL